MTGRSLSTPHPDTGLQATFTNKLVEFVKFSRADGSSGVGYVDRSYARDLLTMLDTYASKSDDGVKIYTIRQFFTPKRKYHVGSRILGRQNLFLLFQPKRLKRVYRCGKRKITRRFHIFADDERIRARAN